MDERTVPQVLRTALSLISVAFGLISKALCIQIVSFLYVR